MPSEKSRALVVGGEARSREALRDLLRNQGMDVTEASDEQAALTELAVCHDVALIAIASSGSAGCELLRKARERRCDTPMIILDSPGSVAGAVAMTKAGAFGYLARPWETLEILRNVQAAIREGRKKPKTQRKSVPALQDLMGHSKRVEALAREVACVAPTDFSVVILGETGVGKELVARAIHSQSRRAPRPFVAVDSGAIPETLIESELFGHERGAFTGADRTRNGKFEAALGGTIVLDEIANLTYGMQSKLLRVLQERRFYRVGGCTAIATDVRVIAATHEELSRADSNAFRRDLYHRLSEYVIHVPPLRERKEDIVDLAKRFVDATNAELGKHIQGLTKEAAEVLLIHEWPGNVRELRNVIRRGVLLAHDWIATHHLSISPPRRTMVTVGQGSIQLQAGTHSLREILQRRRMEVEQLVIREALRQTHGNKAQAARLLQVDYKTMHSKAKKYGFPEEGYGHEAQEA